MARGGQIDIPIAVDTGPSEKAIRNGLIDPIEDAEKAIEDLGRAKGADQLERGIRDAQDATKKLDKELDSTRKSLDKLGYGAKKAGDEASDGINRASETTDEFKSEATQNFSEVASSFSGDMSSAVDLVQGTLGGLASGISGPLGIALGGAAIGVGLIANNFIEAQEEAIALQERAREFAAEAVDTGQTSEEFLTSYEKVLERLKELETTKADGFTWWWETPPTQLQDWSDAAERTGDGLKGVSEVLSMSDDDLKKYTGSLETNRDALRKQQQALEDRNGIVAIADQEEYDALEARIDGYNQYLGYLEDEVTLRNEAAASAGRLLSQEADVLKELAEAEKARTDAIEAVENSVTDAYDNMRDAALTYATDEEGALSIDRWLEYTNEHKAAVENYTANLEQMKLTPEQWHNLLEMPEDQRMQWVAQFTKLPEDARQPFADALNDIASTGGDAAAVSMEDAFDPELSAEVDVEVSVEEQTKKLDELAKPRDAKVTVKTEGTAGAKKSLDDLAKSRSATINVKVSTADANWTMNNWRLLQEAQPVYIDVIPIPGKAQII